MSGKLPRLEGAGQHDVALDREGGALEVIKQRRRLRLPVGAGHRERGSGNGPGFLPWLEGAVVAHAPIWNEPGRNRYRSNARCTNSPLPPALRYPLSAPRLRSCRPPPQLEVEVEDLVADREDDVLGSVEGHHDGSG